MPYVLVLDPDCLQHTGNRNVLLCTFCVRTPGKLLVSGVLRFLDTEL